MRPRTLHDLKVLLIAESAHEIELAGEIASLECPPPAYLLDLARWASHIFMLLAVRDLLDEPLLDKPRERQIDVLAVEPRPYRYLRTPGLAPPLEEVEIDLCLRPRVAK
jgi:hypothetical protein